MARLRGAQRGDHGGDRGHRALPAGDLRVQRGRTPVDYGAIIANGSLYCPCMRLPVLHRLAFRDGLAASGSWSLHVREVGHGAGGCVTRCTSIISRPRPTIRSTSPGRAAWSGNSARRVVVSGRVVTWQSSNCARSVLPAWPLKVISYVGDRTGIMPRNWWLTLVIRVPDGEVRVVTRYWVIRLDAMAAAGLRRAVGTSEARQPAPAAELPSGAAVRPPPRLCGPGSSLPPEIMLRGAPAVGVAR